MYVKRTVGVIIFVCDLAVSGKQRKTRNELQTLFERVARGRPVGALVIRIKAQNAAREHVHHVRRGVFHDDVAHEIRGQGAKIAEHFRETRQLFGVGQFSEKQEIRRLFKAESAALVKAVHQIVDIDTAVKKLAVAGDLVAVGVLFEGVDLRDLGKPADNSVTVHVPQSALDVVFFVKLRIDRAALEAQLGKPRYLLTMLFLQCLLIFFIIHPLS